MEAHLSLSLSLFTSSAKALTATMLRLMANTHTSLSLTHTHLIGVRGQRDHRPRCGLAPADLGQQARLLSRTQSFRVRTGRLGAAAMVKGT